MLSPGSTSKNKLQRHGLVCTEILRRNGLCGNLGSHSSGVWSLAVTPVIRCRSSSVNF